MLLWLALIPLLADNRPSEESRARINAPTAECPGRRPGPLLGLGTRALTLEEMVTELERGCLALDGVRFRPGQDTLESLSPAHFAQIARAIGLARGTYRVTVPPEHSPGSPPDTVQAQRREARLRDELVHYGASASRLREESGWPFWVSITPGGPSVPMLIRVPAQL